MTVKPKPFFTFSILLAALSVGGAGVRAHCDGLDGPVVTVAREAVESADVNRADGERTEIPA